MSATMEKIPDPSEEQAIETAELSTCEPKGLIAMKLLTICTAELMGRYRFKTEADYDKLMHHLRSEFNLNFTLLCEDCGGPHTELYDELLAPER